MKELIFVSALDQHQRERKMDPEPTGMATLAGVAGALKRGEHIVVNLEPGDHTRYTLLLVPMVTASVGNYSPKDREAGLIVVRFTGGHPMAHGIVLLNRGFYEDVPMLAQKNPWTIQLFSWWFDLLAEEMGVK